MRPPDAKHPSPGRAGARPDVPLCTGQSYLERLGVVYMDQIRLTIVTELHMREMGVRQFYETIGGRSYSSVRRHFLKLVEHGWLRKVRTAKVGLGRPEVLYRSTEQAVIDTETWRTIPVSIRDAFTVQLLEEMASRLGGALRQGTADARRGLATFKTIDVDERSWCKAQGAVERCFQTLMQEQTDAKIRLENSAVEPILMVVNLAAFESSGVNNDTDDSSLPKAGELSSPPPWPERIGKVFTDRLDLAIVAELNQAAMTPAQLHAAFGGWGSQEFLRRCKRLTDLGWAVSIDTETGGALYGATVDRFRASAPNVSAADIYKRVPAGARTGRSWGAFEPFIATSISAVETGAFNNRSDRHLSMSPLLVDEIGWKQVTRALRSCEGTLLRLENDPKSRGRQGRFGSRAAFLLSNYQAPLRQMRE